MIFTNATGFTKPPKSFDVSISEARENQVYITSLLTLLFLLFTVVRILITWKIYPEFPTTGNQSFSKWNFVKNNVFFFLNFVLTKTSNIDLVQEQGQNTNYEKKSMD